MYSNISQNTCLTDDLLIIYIYRYEEEILKVGRKKTNLMFIGDGKGMTVISGGKSIQDNITTFRTATFGNFLFLPIFSPLHFLYLYLPSIHFPVTIIIIIWVFKVKTVGCLAYAFSFNMHVAVMPGPFFCFVFYFGFLYHSPT